MKENVPVCPGAAIGMPMIISLEGIGTFKCILIGMDHGRCLIVKFPPMQDIPLMFFQKNHLVVRYFHAGSAYGFRTTVVGLLKDPSRLFVLDYPDSVESLNLRKNERYACLIPACMSMQAVDGELSEWKGSITDISSDGCCFEYHSSADVKPSDVTIGNLINLSFRFPHEDSLRMLPAEVRTVKIDQNKLMFGLKYKPDPAMDGQQAAMDVILAYIDNLKS